MPHPPVTILMTVYNGGPYLKSAIESVLNQTYEDFEFLIINDCSMDHSLEVIESYKDKRLVVHSNEKNLGQTKSLNQGLQLAHGRYIARIDADDIAFPLWLEKVFSFIKREPTYAVVGSNVVVIDDKDRIKKILRVCASYSDVLLRSLTISPISHPGCIMRRDIILEQGGYDETFDIHADYDFWCRLMDAGYKIASVKDILIGRRVHEQSMTISEKYKREQDRRDLSEVSRIFLKHIGKVTAWDISRTDSDLICQLLYNVSALDRAQFQQAKGLLKNIFKYVKPSFMIKKSLIGQALKRQLLIVNVKKAFACSEDNNLSGFRDVVLQGMKETGLFSIFLLFFICSLAGRSFVKHLPALYERLLEVWTYFKLGGKHYVNTYPNSRN